MQESCLIHQFESHGRLWAQQHFVELFGYPFPGQDTQPACHAAHGFHRFRYNAEPLLGSAELGRKTHGAQHPERIVGVSGVGVERSADDAGCEVPYASEGIYKRSEVFLLERESHGVDCEVASQLVVLKGSVLYDRLPRFASVRFFPGSHKLDFIALEVQHCCAEVLEIRHVCAGFLSDRPCEIDAASFDHYVDIVARSAKKTVAYIASYGEGPHAALSGNVAHYAENLFADVL